MFISDNQQFPRQTRPHPLVVNPDALLARAAAYQRFQAVAGRNSQIRQPPRLVQEQ
jgi:hypothetical protein